LREKYKISPKKQIQQCTRTTTLPNIFAFSRTFQRPSLNFPTNPGFPEKVETRMSRKIPAAHTRCYAFADGPVSSRLIDSHPVSGVYTSTTSEYVEMTSEFSAQTILSWR